MLNPVFRREIMTSLRSLKSYVSIMLYVLVLALVAGLSLFATSSGTSYSFRLSDTKYIYAFLAGFQFGLALLITPALTAGAISSEREKQTLNLLLITKMSPLSIAMGKLTSSLITILLMMIASMPVYAIIFYYGGLSLLNLLGMMGYTMLISAMIGSIAIFFSSFIKKTIGATVLTYIVILAFTAGTFFLMAMTYVIFEGMLYGNGDFYALAESVKTINKGLASSNLSVQLIVGMPFIVLNPALSFFSLMDSQFGTAYSTEIIYGITSVDYYSSNAGHLNIYIYSIFVYIAIIALMIYLTSRSLMPVKKSKRYK